MTALLQATGLEVQYGPVAAVRGIDLTVDDGEVVALLGPNGAGKTSVLRAISRLVPCAGTVVFDGRDLRRRSAPALARAGLLHVPEGRHIFPTLSVHENLQVAAAARGRRAGGHTPEQVYELFPMLGDLRARTGWALSGGEQQMLAFGRALVGAPRLLLLDEPSLGLAPSVVDIVLDAIASLRQHVPMLLVEQNTRVALEVADRALVLSDGRVVLEGSADELRDEARLVDSYLGHRDAHGRAPEEDPPGRDHGDR